jgi:nucleotidyltransferase/DNA polymerase involved in DNA repair
MRIGYLQLPQLSIQAALLRHPPLRGQSLIISSDGTRRGRVVDASPSCLALGVIRGMAIREAVELAPTATLLPGNPHADADLLSRAIDLLARFSEVVEETTGDGAWFVPAVPNALPSDERRMASAIVDGLAATLGLDARLGLGPGKFIARVAAERAAIGSIEVVAEGGAAAYLALLPVALLPLLPNAVERLKLLGIVTIGEFARLPPDTLPRRFGREAIVAGQLARGDDRAPLVPRRQPPTLSLRRGFEPAIEDRGILLAVARDLLGRLLLQLQADRRAFRSIDLTAGLDDGRLAERHADLRDPTNDPRRCQSLLGELIAMIELPQSVASLSVRLGSIVPEPISQGEIFGKNAFDRGRAERQERVSSALAEIGRRYRGRVRRIVPGDDPLSLLDDRRLLLLPVEVVGPEQTKSADRRLPRDLLGVAESAIRIRPINLITRRERIYLTDPESSRDEVVALHARWDADEWWPDPTRRTYYRIRMRRGAIVTVARDHDQKRWYLVESFE